MLQSSHIMEPPEADPRFLDILKGDPELLRLERLQQDASGGYLVLSQVMHYQTKIGRLPVGALTPARWSLLWTAGNAFTRDSDPKAVDADVFLYVLAHDIRRLHCPLAMLPAMASGYSRATHMQPEQVRQAIRILIQTAFAPLRQLPASPEDQDQVCFDAQWLVDISSTAARESGLGLEYCKFDMSMAESALLYVHQLKRTSSPDYARRIRRTAPPEIDRAFVLSVRELRKQYRQGLL